VMIREYTKITSFHGLKFIGIYKNKRYGKVH